jgi:hypothetical protein
MLASMLLIAKATLYQWRKTVLEKGEKAFLSPNRPGPKPDPENSNGRRKLSPAQEAEIQLYNRSFRPSNNVCDNINSVSWDKKTILEMIKYLYGITMTVQTLSKYLKHWN